MAITKQGRATVGGVHNFEKFRKLNAITFTPSDSPIEGFETAAIEAIQEYLGKAQNFVVPQPGMSLAYFLKLVDACDVVLREGIASPRFGITFTKHVAAHYSRT